MPIRRSRKRISPRSRDRLDDLVAVAARLMARRSPPPCPLRNWTPAMSCGTAADGNSLTFISRMSRVAESAAKLLARCTRRLASKAKLPNHCASPKRAICSSARLLQLLRPFGMHCGSCMSSQGALWLLPLLAPHSTWQHLQSLEDKEPNPSRETSLQR